MELPAGVAVLADLELLLVGLVMAASGERSTEPEDFLTWMHAWDVTVPAFVREAHALDWRSGLTWDGVWS